MTTDRTATHPAEPRLQPAAEPPAGRLVLVRHGETSWSRTGQHTGRTDIPLTDAGRGQARALARLLAPWEIVSVVSSPLSRARDTADLAGLDVASLDDDLLEWDYGAHEGLTTAQIRAALGVPWDVFTHGTAPGQTPGESLGEVAERASRVLARVAADLARGDVALVGHGHALRVLAAVYLRQEPTLGQHLVLDAGSVSVLGHHRESPVIVRWNQQP